MQRHALFLLLFFVLFSLPGLVDPTAAAALPPQAGNDWRFGLVETYESPGDAAAAGAAWTRVRFQWADVQAGGPGSWTPSVSDAQINGEINAGRLVVGLLIGIPGWARDGNQLPAGLWLPHDNPGNTWANFVREAVSRYSGRINHWVIWNEPDIADVNAPGHTWDGSVEDFFQLQRTAYLVAKATNPRAVVHLSAFTYYADPGYFHRYLDVVVADPAAPDNNYYFDVATAHLYFQPNQIFNIIQGFFGTMSAHGFLKPIWLVETNAPPIDDPGWPVPNWTLSVTQNEQAAFLPQAMAAALAAGAERIAVYKLKDTPGDRAANPEPFGLLREDGSRRPAFTTYQVATQYLAGMTGARRERWNEVGQIRISQSGKTTTVLFARLPAPQQAQVTATANTAVLVDMWGSRQTITARNGLFTVDLPGALCTQPIGDYCMIGGTTYYLVQSSDGAAPPPPPPGPSGGPAPTTAVTPATAAATNTPTATPTSTPSPTPSPSATASPSPSPTPTELPPTATPTMTASATVAATIVAQQPTAVPPPLPNPTGGQPGYWLIALGLLAGLGLLYLYRRPS